MGENIDIFIEHCILYLLEPACLFLVVVYDQLWIWFLEAADSVDVYFLYLVDGILYLCRAQLGCIVLLATCDLSVMLLVLLDSAESICLLSADDDLDLVHKFGHALPFFTLDLDGMELLLCENLEMANQCVH